MLTLITRRQQIRKPETSPDLEIRVIRGSFCCMVMLLFGNNYWNGMQEYAEDAQLW
jgi:hypothetical protein